MRAIVRTVAALMMSALELPGELAFERRTQTKTRGDTWPSQEVISSALNGDGNHYKPINRRRMVKVLREVDIDIDQAAFVDLGCGKGRALYVAAEFGYRRVVGVEYVPVLAKLARTNADAYRKAHRAVSDLSIEVIEGDAVAYSPRQVRSSCSCTTHLASAPSPL